MTETKDDFSPEKRMKDLIWKGIKKSFLLTIALITYWQLYEYINESPDIEISITESIKKYDKFESKITIKNGSQSIISTEVIRPIELFFNDTIRVIKPITKTEIKTDYKIYNQKNVVVNFDLINKKEEFSFIIYTYSRPEIDKVDFRIKNIDEILIYDYENRPKPIYRILSIWIIIFVLSIILIIDALLVILKDFGLQKIKNFISDFPLNKENINEFIEGYKDLYKKYKLRIKPSAYFMEQIIRNIFICFPMETKEDVNFIKAMTDFKTELYIQYRTRTSFIVISFIAVLISLLAILLNYFYYEIDFLKTNISLDFINKGILTILLILALMIILFPRSTMNLLFVKKEVINFKTLANNAHKKLLNSIK